MTINPTDRARNCEVHVKYGGDGTVYADDERINSDLDSTLNLNLQRLCDNRKAVLDGALENLRRRRPDGIWTKSFLEGEIHAWRERSSTEHFREYCQIVVCHLRLKQKQVSK